jgi:hypothetical protein
VHPKLRRHPEVLAAEARLRTLQKEEGPFLQALGELVKGAGGTPQRLVPQLTAEQHGIPVWWRSVPNGVSRWLTAARSVAPGSFLRAIILRDKNKDSRRAPKLSDNADEFHVAFIPYVDVFTLDRENLAIMKRHLGSTRVVRRANLVQNGDDEGLVRAIEALAARAAE